MNKRTNQPRVFTFTKSFHKDWERHIKAGRMNMRKLKDVMLLLIANDGPLGPEWLDHPLKGDWSDHRECHVSGDFLLIYKASEAGLIFVRIGTHAELFE
jgi:mRNA interferase YafQ